jgi:Tfp pilus assembly protein PilO
MLANRTSRWSIGTALLCIALLAASWFLLISPRRADAADIRLQVDKADAQAATLNVEISQLKVDFADLPKQKAKLKAIKKQLPPGANIPALVRQLQNLAAQSGLSLDSIAPGAPTVVLPADVVAPPATTAPGAGALVAVPMTVTLTGDYFEASLFVKRLQTKIQRSYLITGFSAIPAEIEATVAPAPVVPVIPTATGTAAPVVPVPTATPTVAPASLKTLSLTLNGAVFVLLDGVATLDDVAKDAKAAAKIPTQDSAATPMTQPTVVAN